MPSGPARGLGTYIQRLVQALPDVMEVGDEILLFTPIERRCVAPVRNVSLGRSISQYAWEQAVIPRLARVHAVDVLHSPSNTRPFLCRVPVVTTVHDTIMYDPEKADLYERYVRWATARSMTASARVITVSYASKKRLEQRFPRSSPVTVVYNGPPLSAHSVAAAKREKVIVHFAHPNPRKNTQFVLGLAGYMEGWQFVLIGMSEAEARSRWNVEIPRNVVLTGFVSDEAKRIYLSTAAALVYVSRHEGFGLPVLEAQSQGCPVVTVDDEAVEEVGGTARFVVPLEHAMVARGLEALWANRHDYESLVDRGFANLQRFNWKATAAQTYAVYRMVQRRQHVKMSETL